MREPDRKHARQIANEYLAIGDALGWFDALYSSSAGDASLVPWADLAPNANVTDWLDGHSILGLDQKALIVGCGLGDDAEELARRGFNTTAFDISPTAIAWCRQRFPETTVHYVVGNLFSTDPAWRRQFDFVLESYTLQVLPLELRQKAIRQIASFVAPEGHLLVIARGRERGEPIGEMPWPLARDELQHFVRCGLTQKSFEDYLDQSEDPPARRFRVLYQLPR